MKYKELEESIKQKGFTMNSIAPKMGLTPQGLTAAIKKDTLKVKDLEKISMILGINPCLFLGDDNYDTNISLHVTNGTNNNGIVAGDIKVEIADCKHELEAARTEIGYLKQQVMDRDTIIGLLKPNK